MGFHWGGIDFGTRVLPGEKIYAALSRISIAILIAYCSPSSFSPSLSSVETSTARLLTENANFCPPFGSNVARAGMRYHSGAVHSGLSDPVRGFFNSGLRRPK